MAVQMELTRILIRELSDYQLIELHELDGDRAFPIVIGLAYFATRPRTSQLGAWASRQSRELGSRAQLMAALIKYQARFLGRTVPRPPHWSGFRVIPNYFEFWVAGAFRLHDRTAFKRTANGWRSYGLYP